MKTITLPAKLTHALAYYYISRGRARSYHIGSYRDASGNRTETYSKTKDWDKDGCLARITEALPKGWKYQAISGTFWFTRPIKRNKTVEVVENSWPLAKISE